MRVDSIHWKYLSLLLLWLTLWALWIAGDGSPSTRNILIFCTGVVLMRAAGCIMNDVADRDFDPTIGRPPFLGDVDFREDFNAGNDG